MVASVHRSALGIALCAYNGSRFLAAQFESIFAQSRVPDLVVACDDASTDDSAARLQALAASAPFPMRVVRNERNLGYLRNFEQAISLCEADIVVLSDQDDWWRADKLERIETIFASDPAVGGVFSDAEIVDGDLKPLGYRLLDVLRVSARERELLAGGDLLAVLLRRNVVAGATFAFRARCKSWILPFPEGAVHDEWAALVIAATGGLRFIAEPLVRYRQHGENQIGARPRGLMEQAMSLMTSRRAADERVLSLMRELHRRLAKSASGLAQPAALREVAGKIEHIERRVALSKSRFLRLPTILGEMMKGGYSRYSSGWRAAVRDFVSPR